MLQSRLQKHCKTLQKMLQSTLKNKFNTEGSHDQWYSFKRQRNCCLNILPKAVKQYVRSLNINQMLDNKVVWNIVIF